MTESIILEVPFSEKDNAKSLGAKWNPKIKKWYIPAGINKEKFAQWIPPDISNTPTLVAKAPIYLLKSWKRCWKCGKLADVFCLASNGLKDDEAELDMFFHFSNLAFVPKSIESILKKHASSYYMDYTKQSNSYYYVNHCKCAAKLGDFYMHGEPDGAFVPMSESQARDIIMYHIESLGDININASYGTQDIEFIPEFAKREKL
ncbi:hypothetical protein KAW08_01995 [bacterium]|nr:hypothetical protein [bacterium]